MTLWGVTKAGVSSYLINNKLTQYVMYDESEIKRNEEKPEDFTKYLLEMKSRLGVIFPEDLEPHVLQYWQLPQEQKDLFIPQHTYYHANNINNNMRRMQTFEELYGHKPNSNDVYKLTGYTTFESFRAIENRHNYPYKKYYDSTPKSVPGTEILTPEDIRIIDDLSQLSVLIRY